MGNQANIILHFLLGIYNSSVKSVAGVPMSFVYAIPRDISILLRR